MFCSLTVLSQLLDTISTRPPFKFTVDPDNSCKGKHTESRDVGGRFDLRLFTIPLLLALLATITMSCLAKAQSKSKRDYKPVFFATAKSQEKTPGEEVTSASSLDKSFKGNSRTHYPKLTDVVRQTMAIHFGETDRHFASLEEFARSLPVPPYYEKPQAVFVTLSHHGKTRACWGSIDPLDTDVVKATVMMTEAALTKEYRYPRIKRGEWKLLKPQVTIVRGIESIPDMSSQDPLKYGLLVRAGGKGAVYLPGEAADAHYQLVQCKLKAGIPVKQPCQLYRIKADVIL